MLNSNSKQRAELEIGKNMRAYGVLASPENGLRHDAGIVIEAPREFAIIYPHLLGHLIAKQKEEMLKPECDLTRLDDLFYTARGIDHLRELQESGNFPVDLGMRLTPQETEAVHQRLSGTRGAVTQAEVVFGGKMRSLIAKEYLKMMGLMPDNMLGTEVPQKKPASSAVSTLV